MVKLVTSLLLVFHESGDAESAWQALRSHFTQSHSELAKAAAPWRGLDLVGRSKVPSLIYTFQWLCDMLACEEMHSQALTRVLNC